jgi:hypothetical protein
MSRRSSIYSSGQASLDSFSTVPGFGFQTWEDKDVPIKDPFSKGVIPATRQGRARLAFANRYGLSAYASNAEGLADALASPAQQLKNVNARLGDVVTKLTGLYENYVASLRTLYVPEDIIYAKADAYIRPLMAAEMDILRMEYPYAVGQLGGGQFTPLAGIAEGRGDASAYQARKEFSNWRSLKKTFKKQRKDRKRRKTK